jgi:hypothetical protein
MKLLKTMRALARSQYTRILLAFGIGLALANIPAFAQFTGGVSLVDPTQGAQSLAKYVIDGLLYVAAAAAALCFLWGCFRLFSRPLEGILEVAVGLIVLGLIGHVLQWGTALTGVTVG